MKGLLDVKTATPERQELFTFHMTLYIGLGVLAVLVIFVIAVYNGLVVARVRVKEAWSDIDIQLKRRFDLIPNLVNTVKGSTSFEQGTLEKIVAARSRAMEAKTPQEIGEADKALSGELSRFFVLAESYPDLKSNQNFLSLQEELSDTENKIQAARRFYNSVATDYNTKVQTFPSNLFATLFSFTGAEFFELGEGDDAARNPVAVSF